MKLSALNEHASAARLRVDALEAELAAAYLAALRAAGRKAAARFRGAVTVKAITAATNPWVPPDPAELLDQAALAAAAQKKAAPVQQRALRLAVPVGISFDLSNPLATAFLDGIAARSAQILDGFATEIGAAIGQAYDEGLSVPKAAQLLRSRIESATEIQAQLLARSDLVSIANGGSLLAAQIVNQASVDAGETGVRFKVWKTAEDDRVRPDHADADGQAVPLDQPFDVGGEQLQYPGDPDGSLEQTANCRCAILMSDEAMTAAAGPEVSTLAMVAVHPTADEASTLAVDGGLPPDELHVTLLFLGDAASLDAQAVKDAVAAVAKTLPPIEGSVGGAAHFAEGPDGYPSILLPDVKGLSTLQETLRAHLAEAGIKSPSEHGFLPHMTLTYADAPEVPDVEALGSPLHFENLSVVVGGERTDYPLTGALTSGGTMRTSPEVTPAPLALRDFHLTAAADGQIGWQATLLVEDEPTEDGRMIAAGATTWRALPLTLLAQLATDDGHDGAQVCGRIDQIWRAGNLIQAAGVFDSGDFGQEVARLVGDRTLTGISVDLAVTNSEVVVSRPEPDPEEEQEILDEVAPVIDGTPVPDYEEELEYLFVVTEGTIGAATVCAFQAIAQARIEVVTAASGAETWQIVAPFEATRCEIPGTFAAGEEISRTDTLAILHRGLDALAASAAAPPDESQSERLEALTASVATVRKALDEQRAEQRTAAEAFATAQTARERALRDEITTLQAEQRATFAQSAALLEAFDAMTETFGQRLNVLTAIDEKVTRAVAIAERKPRQLEIKRDKTGRIVGTAEV